MSLQQFVRCTFCGMPHEAALERCPITGDELPAARRLAERRARMTQLEGKLVDGKYRLHELIGEGGMGLVYRAVNELLENEVAIKVLHDSLQEDSAARRRFEREGFVGGALSHPNLVRTYDGGLLPDGRPFLVMELLKGEALTERLEREGPMTVPDTVFVAEHVLRGLAATHDQAIVHRDVKPDNIFLRNQLAGIDSVKLIDFSVSKFVEEATRVSVDGEVLGTAAYLSPEQAMGQRNLDHRVDIWAVGVVLYEMLTGEPPFLEDNLIDTVTAILHRDPPAPSRYRPDVHPGLDAIILRALDKNRLERWPTALSMIEALRDAGGSDTWRPMEDPDFTTAEREMPPVLDEPESLDDTLPR
ncbi:MAG: serine/threonine protein kinase [Sandaracinaceae bacterium]|nr:serine/threonine protein kinase [Sandaracinaceae bacterium]